MLDHFTKEQLEVVQGFLLDNAKAAHVPLTEIYFIRCDPCRKCTSDCPGFNGVEWIAATPCDFCGDKLFFDLDGTSHCDNKECQEVRAFYGYKTTKRHYDTLRGKEFSRRRTAASTFFKEAGKQNFYGLTFEQLKLGMLLEYKTIISDTVKQLMEVKNGTDRARNT